MSHLEAEPSPEQQLALDQQQDLLEDSLELVHDTYQAALAEKMRQPVVILLDCEDEIGGEIARGWLGDDAVDDAIAEQQAESSDQTTVYAQAFAWAECCEQIPAVFPYLAPVFSESPPADGFLAISVTCGGASALTVPFSSREA